MASTANDLRKDRYITPMNPEKLNAAAQGFKQSISFIYPLNSINLVRLSFISCNLNWATFQL